MKSSESLLKIDWIIPIEGEEQDISDRWLELELNETENVIIYVSGIDFASKLFLDELGTDILDSNAKDSIVKSINNARGYYPEIKELIHNPNYEPPEFGELIVVIKIHTFQCNHYLDPIEWDTDITFLGILGEEVKLSY